MDVIDELKLIKDKGYGHFFDHAMEQKEIWEKKLHMLKAFNVVTELQSAIEEGFFKEKNVTSFTLEVCYTGTHYYYFSMYENEKNVNFFNEIDLDVEPVAKIKGALTEMHGLNLDYIGKVFNEHIYLDSGNIREKIFDMLLSKELKTILEYSEMQQELKEKNSLTTLGKFKV